MFIYIHKSLETNSYFIYGLDTLYPYFGYPLSILCMLPTNGNGGV